MTIGGNKGDGGYSSTFSNLLILLAESWEQGVLISRVGWCVRPTWREVGFL